MSTTTQDAVSREVPLFKVVRDALRMSIEEGQYEDGDLIPPEPALCQQFAVSRITVRRAVTELADEGLLEKVPGKGTFVRSGLFSSPSLVSLAGFGRGGERFRVGPRRRVLGRSEEPANERLAQLLGVKRGATLYSLERLMLDGTRPIAIDTTHYVAELVPGFLTHIDDDVSTFEVLERIYGIHLGGSQGRLRVGFATARQAELMGIATNDPLLLVDKVISTQAHVPLIRSEIAYNPRGVSLRFQADEGTTTVG
ncbi:MAG TPA: GntR family transcriptional regulator [Propionibacteriaceae bacterium]|nr:GntR family transcriptional regulator [Propionibacteriaceae bacterium]